MNYRPSDLLRGRAIPDQVLRELPKTDLHVHLDGSLRPGTFLELGRAAGLDLPDDPAELRARFFPGAVVASMPEFLAHFDHTLRCLQTADSLERVARELAEDAAALNVRILEARFCPLLHTRQGLTPDGAVAAVHRGLAAVPSVNGGIIITGLRTIDPAQSLQLARLAVAWKSRGVVAFDLAGAEAGQPAADHREAFYHCMNNNLPATCHAGEGYGPESIHMALHRCGAKRIGHGTRLEEDPDLMAYVADHRIPLEICLTSNVQMGVVRSVGEHPLRRYHEAGLRVCLNTDNTLFADTDIARELRLAVDTFDFTLLQLEDIILGGFKSAFVPEQHARVLIEQALADFAQIRHAHRLDRLVAAGDSR
ncbi:MAG: adenosine deaminase [Candidatus Krumholzibacteriia bacterium]